MNIVESMIAKQVERYADVSYFPSVRLPAMDSYVVDAAFEHALIDRRVDELHDRIDADRSRNMAIEVCGDYLEEEGVRGIALGVFASASLSTGEHVLILPWVMSRELARKPMELQHAPVASEVLSELANLNMVTSGRPEGAGYVLDIPDKKTLFVLDSARDKRLLFSPLVRRGLQAALRILPNLEVAYGGEIITAPGRPSRRP
ncbi:MAG: hypothetical protein JWO99_574 [Candidatus Saccharibacteria bacterium]|nr:hypothetical protein [Candidatus Saccharibacteria bacterium]